MEVKKKQKSIKVQAWEEYFNSIMVRLKGLEQVKLDESQVMFQFHYGSIKRRAYGGINSRYACFNSIMVRLKVYNFVCFRFSI